MIQFSFKIPLKENFSSEQTASDDLKENVCSHMEADPMLAGKWLTNCSLFSLLSS
jgi:hypothetical protein